MFEIDFVVRRIILKVTKYFHNILIVRMICTVKSLNIQNKYFLIQFQLFPMINYLTLVSNKNLNLNSNFKLI